MIMKPLASEEDYRGLLELSRETPVYLLKHSLICPISSAAFREFDLFLKEKGNVSGFVLRIQENRGLSKYIAENTGVTHQSPQVLLYKDEKVVWDDSHYSISVQSLDATLS